MHWGEPWQPFGVGGRNFEVFPRCSIIEKEDHSIIQAECPGIPQDRLNVEVKGNELTISGEMSEQKEEKNERYHLNERRFGKFRRSFTLPDGLKPEEISATTNNGVLEIRVPKNVAQTKGHKVAINNAARGA